MTKDPGHGGRKWVAGEGGRYGSVLVPRTSLRTRATAAAVVGTLIAALGLFFVVRTIVRNWDETKDLIADAQVAWLVAAAPVALLGMSCVGVPWRRAMRLVGADASTADTLRWFFPGQLGKYVPGGVWPVVGRGELAVRGGLPRGAAYSSVGLSIATTYLAAVLVAALSLPFAAGDLADGDPPLWVLAGLPLGLVVLHPAILRRIVAVGERVLGKAANVTVPAWRDTVALVVVHVPAWLLIATATWLVTRAFDPSPPVAGLLFATVVSWIVGFVVVGVPGGIGVREATFAAVVAGAVPTGVGATAALAARLVFMLADTSGALLVALVRRRAAR